MDPFIFSGTDIAIGFIYLIILLGIAFSIRNKNKENPAYSYFIPNLLFKLFFGVFFGITFMIILGYGGDTLAYYQSATKLHNLFFEHPIGYFKELFSTPDRHSMGTHFTSSTGYPPGWIYYEPESFFVAKLYSVLSILTFKSYTAITLLSSYFAAIASFKLFQIVYNFKFAKIRMLALATMFIPTVAFWCTGMSKDTVVLGVFYIMLYHIFAYFDPERKFTLKNFIYLLLFGFLIYHIRPFMISAMLPPLLFGFSIGYINTMKSQLFKVLIKFVFFSVSLITIGMVLGGSQIVIDQAGGALEEVAVTQQDFAKNQTYGGPRYDLGVTDLSPLGMIRSAPIAIFTALYRPMLNEAAGPLLLISGIENLIFLFLTLGFFFRRGNFAAHLNYITNHEFLSFCLFFILFFGFFVGFTAGLFNILVRFKAPILAFFVLILIAKNPDKIKKKAEQLSSNET